VRERWRRRRASRYRAALVERVTQRLIMASGYDVKFPAQEAFFREHAEQIVATEERQAIDAVEGGDGHGQW